LNTLVKKFYVFIFIFIANFHLCAAGENASPICSGAFEKWDNCYGKSRYVDNIKSGIFIKGKLEGVGRYQFANGEYYDAEFKNDIPIRILERGYIDLNFKTYDITEAQDFFSDPKYQEYRDIVESIQEKFNEASLDFKLESKLENNAHQAYLILIKESNGKKISDVKRYLIKSLAASFAMYVDRKNYPILLREVAEFFTKKYSDGHPYFALGLSYYVDYYIAVGPVEKIVEESNKLLSSNRIVSLLEIVKLDHQSSRICDLQSNYIRTSLIFYDFFKEYKVSLRAKNENQKITFDCTKPKDSLDSLFSYAESELFYGDPNQTIFLTKLAFDYPFTYDKNCKGMYGSDCNIYAHTQLALAYRKLSLEEEMNNEINLVRSLCELGGAECAYQKETHKKIFFADTYSAIDEESLLIKQVQDASASNSDFGLDFFLSELSSFYKNKNIEKAIFYKKLATQYLYIYYLKTLRDEKKLGTNFKSFYDHFYQDKLRDLAELLILAARLDEADKILSLVKESEMVEFTRGDSTKVAKLSEIHFNSYEKEFLNDFNAVNNSKSISIININKKIDSKQSKTNFSARKEIDITEANPISHLENVILLRYITKKDKSYVIISTSKGQDSRAINISESDLNAKIFLTRQLLSTSKSDPIPQLTELYNLLFKPLEVFIDPAKKPTVILSLDKNLRYLPFSALFDGKQYLVEKYSLALYLDSAKDKLLSKRSSDSRGMAYGVSKKIKNYQQLPYVADEILNLIKTKNSNGLIPGKVFLNDRFTFKSLDEIHSNPHPVLHFSSHFIFSPGSEENSYLLLGDGNKLSIKDIRRNNFDFKGTNLVTLSACDTAKGGGKDQNGKEIDGLSDLILERGAESVLSSLWKVADKSTTVLISKFYKNYFALKLSKADSLRKAQLDLIHQNGLFKHPYFWSPFIIIGNYL
jgi:CHAT domain-containing protein